MRKLLFYRRLLQPADHFVECFDAFAIDSAQSVRFQVFQVLVNLRSLCGAGSSQGDDERAAVERARLAGHQAARDQAVEDAGQRRAFMREGAMQVGDGRIPRFGEVAENMSLGLIEIGSMTLDEESDPVGSAMDFEDESQVHQISGYLLTDIVRFRIFHK